MYMTKSRKLVRTNYATKYNTETVGNTYTGFLIYSRKTCGADFMDKFLDGTVNFDLYDYTGEYVPLYRYYRTDGGRSSMTLQFKRSEVADSTLGNAKKDQFFLELSGLDQVDFGGEDETDCIESVQLGVGDIALSDADQTPCVGWQKTVGFS